MTLTHRKARFPAGLFTRLFKKGQLTGCILHTRILTGYALSVQHAFTPNWLPAVGRTRSGTTAAEAHGVIHAHFASHSTNFRRFADEKLNFTFKLDTADNFGSRANNDFGFAPIPIPAPSTRLFDDQVTA